MLGEGDVVHVDGRTWFDRPNGTSYFTAEIFVNGELVAFLPFQSGYGNQFAYEAIEALRRQGLLPQSSSPIAPAPWQVAEKYGFRFVSKMANVGRKKDLHGEGKI